MTKQAAIISRACSCLNWDSLRNVLLVITMLGLLVAIVPAVSANSSPRAQAALLQFAAEHPDSVVGVIVQKAVRDARVEDHVLALGGTITRDLWIINAFAARLPAKAVAELARADGVRWVSMDAPIAQSSSPCSGCVDVSNLQDAYVSAIGAVPLWNEAPHLQGKGITVAIVDSGIDILNRDLWTAGGLGGRIVASVDFNTDVDEGNPIDRYGHGTHVAGIIGGNGTVSKGAYIGVAPQVSFVSVKVSDKKGAGLTSDVVAGLQWVYQNKARYNIRVLNLSLNSSIPESYNTSPLDAALEILWFNRIVVVVSAGNSSGRGYLHPPANDPFVITVGATDDRGTANVADDVMASFSAYGRTQDHQSKPDLVAPGTNIVSLLSSVNATLAQEHPDHIVSPNYFRMSGTSMASAVTAGAAALLIQSNPNLTPDQIKYRLMDTAKRIKGQGTGAGYLNIYSAVHGGSTKSANSGLRPSRLLYTGSDPISWNSVNWDSVNWDSVNWDSVNWDSVNWDSVNWDSDYWGN